MSKHVVKCYTKKYIVETEDIICEY
jgi:hypothetical protein